MLTDEQKASIQARLAKNPSILFETLAESNDASEAEMIECLPRDLWAKASSEHFQAILTQMATWGKVTVILHSSGSIFEFSGSFPFGAEGHGYYNLENAQGLSGHLHYKNCTAIYFITRPFRGTETKSILFADQEGRIIFKIFLGRDEHRAILPQQIEKFAELAQSYGVHH